MKISQIQALVTKPRNASAIQRGVIHSRRLRFHNDATLSYYDALGTYLHDFLRWVKELLPADKYDRFTKLITYPVATNELVENIWKNLARVFEGENRTIDVKFDDKSLLVDFKKFFDNSDFQKKMFQAIQSDIDSVVVCDFPVEGGNPYYYIVPSTSLIDVDTDGDDVIYVIFEDGNGDIVSMDAEFTRVFDGKDRNNLKLISESPNVVGETTARMIWCEPLTSENPINRKSPMSSVLGDLDRLLFDCVSRDYAEMYGKFPILVSYDIDETYTGGKSDQRNMKEGAGKQFLGPGSITTTPMPSSKDEPDLNTNAVRFVNADPDILKFIDQRLTADKDRIFKSVVGDSGEVRNDAAKNDKQLDSVFESKQDVINKLKHPLEEIHEWVIETLCKMAYGDRFLDCEVDYGSQFYLTDEYTLLAKLAEAKYRKSPDAVISDITHQYFETKYRADSETKKRMKIVLDLDPFPSKNIDEVYVIFSTSPDLVGLENMWVKMHMDALLQRFERENVPLTQFGNQFEYYEKIEIINKTIRGYAKGNKIDTGQQRQPVPN